MTATELARVYWVVARDYIVDLGRLYRVTGTDLGHSEVKVCILRREG